MPLEAFNAAWCELSRSRLEWMHLQCESKKPPWGLVAIFPKRLGIFQPNFTCLLRVPIYARLQTFIQLSATLTKLCHIKRDHPVQIVCAKCSPSAETHADIFPKQLGIFNPNFTRLLYVHKYARVQIFIQLSPIISIIAVYGFVYRYIVLVRFIVFSVVVTLYFV